MESVTPGPGDVYRRRRVRSLVPLGVLDAGLSSLATFAAGFVAVTVLTDVDRGVYAVFFAAFTFGGVVPHQLIFMPAEVEAVRQAVPRRLGVLEDSIRLSVVPALVGVLIIAVAGVLTVGLTDLTVVVGLGVTTALTTFVWPIQDHVRRMLHIGDKSVHAVLVSAIQLVVTIGCLVLMQLADVPTEWIPFGALALANFVSTIAGLVYAGVGLHRVAEQQLTMRPLLRAGRWFLVAAGTPMAANLAVATIITYLAGAAEMGYAEAARVVAQPAVVLATGLHAVLGPRVMEAAAVADRRAARHPRSVLIGLTTAIAIPYMLVAGVEWPGNPLPSLVPSAYEVDWLVLATIAVTGVFAWLPVLFSELSAARREVALAAISVASAPFQIAAAATAGVTGAYARPLSLAAGRIVWGTAAVRKVREVYSSGRPVSAGARSAQGRGD